MILHQTLSELEVHEGPGRQTICPPKKGNVS